MKLTTQEQRAILRGEHPALTWDGEQECPVVHGEEIVLNERFAVIISRVRKGPNGEHLTKPQDYTIRDFTPRYLRRVPAVFEAPEVDETGVPVPPSAEAIEKARKDGSYTTSADQAIADAGEGVDDDTLRLITTESRLRFAEGREEDHGERLALQQTNQLMRKLRRLQSEAARHGVDLSPRLLPVVREVEREIAGKRVA